MDSGRPQGNFPSPPHSGLGLAYLAQEHSFALSSGAGEEFLMYS